MKRILSTFSIVFLVIQSFCAQDGSVDYSFNSATALEATNTNFNNITWCTFQYPNGEYLVCGAFTSLNGTPANRIVKLDQEGHIIQGFPLGNGPDSTINGALVLSSGKILIHGLFSNCNSIPSPGIVLLNADGSLYENFQFSNPFIEIKEAIELNDGRILIGGALDNSGHSRIIRISTDGSIDPDFNVNVEPGIKKLTTDSIGSIYACGDFTTIGGVARNKIAKLFSNGIVDTTYTIPSNYSVGANDILVHSDGTLVLSCEANVSGNHGRFRFYPDGTHDTTFHGAIVWSRYLQVETDPLGRYYFLVTNNQRYWVERLDSNGTLDNTFEIQHFLSSSYRTHFLLEPNGKIMVSGAADFYGFYLGGLQRLNANGTVDASFMPTKGFNRPVTVMKTQADGKTLVGGNFYGFNGKSYGGVVRVLTTGELDMSFQCGTGAIDHSDTQTDDLINSIEIQSDGKILIGGAFEVFNGKKHRRIVRLLPNGSIDTTFHTGNGFGNTVETILAQPDGRILIGGHFMDYDQYGPHSSAAFGIIRLQSNGFPDPTFPSNTMSGIVKTIELLPNGLLMLGGTINSYNGLTVHNLIRVHQDGQIDNSFVNNSGIFGSVNDIAVQEDGKFIVATGMANYLGQQQPTLYRFQTNGLPDSTFIPTGINTTVDCRQLVLQPDGKILVVATQELSQSHFNLYRLHPAGQKDTTFYPLNYSDSLLFVEGIKSCSILPDGKIIAGGKFSICNGYLANNLVKLNNSATPDNCTNFGLQIHSVSNIECSGGSAVVKAFGQNGLPPYSYSWDNAPLIVEDTLFTTTDAGIHYLTVTDTSGCTRSTGYLVDGPLSQIDDRVILVTTSFRPGFANATTIEVLNNSCTPSSGTLKLIKDPLLNFQSSDPAPVSISGDTLSWEYGSLVFDSGHYIVHILCETSTNAIIGDNISLSLYADSQGFDSDSSNNIFTNTFPILNGYDPNDIQVYPKGYCQPGYIQHGEELTYTIRFQNTGNSEAINIHIIDSISDFLDLSSLRVLSSSHSMHTEIISGSIVNFVFNQINLPDSSSNEEGSHGYVVYAIKQQPFLYEHSQIRNKASIYFDFNSPVNTNEVINTVINYNPGIPVDTLFVTVDDSYFWEGNTYNESGIYTINYASYEFCDSIVCLNLFVTHNSYANIAVEACNGWSSPDGNEFWTNSGIYYDTITNSYGADSIITINLTIIMVNNGIELIDGINAVSLETNASVYQWLDCNSDFSPIQNATGIGFTALENGFYAVQVILNGCIDTSDCVHINSVGMNFNNPQYDVLIAPNPTTGTFTVEIPQSYEAIEWELIQLTGKIVQTGTIENSSITIHISEKPGIYYLSLKSLNGVITRIPVVRN